MSRDAELLEAVLTRAAERIGDIRRPVMDRLYATHPEVRESFLRHAAGVDVRHLEEMMMDNLLYCLMGWHDRQAEIRIMLADSVPHHEEALQVSADWYGAMFEAGIDVLEGVAEGEEEMGMLRELRRSVANAVAQHKASTDARLAGGRLGAGGE